MRQDPNRLQALRQCLILDSSPERVFDDLTHLLASSLEVPLAMVNLLDAQRDWFKSAVGAPLAESPASTSFCEVFFRSDQDVIVVGDTLLDKRFATHPLVLGEPHIRFYAAARLVLGGHTLGTLCAYDMRPRQISADQLQQVQSLAEAAVDLLRQRSAGAAR